MKTEREKIIEHFKKALLTSEKGYLYAIDLDIISDFILADRKRIVEPLVKIKDPYSDRGWSILFDRNMTKSIDETLKNAGVL